MSGGLGVRTDRDCPDREGRVALQDGTDQSDLLHELAPSVSISASSMAARTWSACSANPKRGPGWWRRPRSSGSAGPP